MDAKFLKPLHVFKTLTDAGLEKKFATGLCVPSRTFRSAPLPTQLLVFRNKFERENSHGPSATQSTVSVKYFKITLKNVSFKNAFSFNFL